MDEKKVSDSTRSRGIQATRWTDDIKATFKLAFNGTRSNAMEDNIGLRSN